MSSSELIIENYTRGGLLSAIQTAITKLGKTPQNITVEELAAVDEFHIGGRVATEHLLDQLAVKQTSHVLDVGCGLGGASRFVAHHYGCQVTGIDLTPEYVETGNILNSWVGLQTQVQLKEGSALAMPFTTDTFDGGFMNHVGMNIGDKAALFREIYRVLRPNALFGVYDIMRLGDGKLAFPVPWATVAESSHLATVGQYEKRLKEAGFIVKVINNRQTYALDFFQKQRAKAAKADGPPPLGLHTLIGEQTPIKFRNMVASITAGDIAPVEIIVQKH